MRIQIVVTDNQSLRVSPVQIFQQPPHCSLLRLSPGICGLSSDIQPALIADTYRVGIMVLAVGTDHILRPSRLDLSVTTDHVMIPDAQLPAPLSVPRIYLRRRTRLPRPHRRTMNYY